MRGRFRRRRGPLHIIVAVLVGLAGATTHASLATAWQPKNQMSSGYDPILTETMLNGTMAWAGDHGFIHWSQPPPAATGVPSYPHPEQIVSRCADANVMCPGRTHEFTSQPLPTTVYTNLSAGIQIRIAVKLLPDPPRALLPSGQPWPVIDAELNVGDRFAGGVTQLKYRGAQGDYVELGIRFFPEVAVLPEDSVLKLRFLVVHHQRGFEFGGTGVTAPRIEIHQMSADDAARYYAESADADPMRTFVQAAGIPWPVLALPLALARRKSDTIAVMLALSAVLSGCLGSPGNAEEKGTENAGGHVEITQGDDRFGLADHGQGAILGRVRDDLGLPLGGANVALSETANFTTSDGKGLFSFNGLLPGRLTLILHMNGYHSIREPVDVAADKITYATFTLQPTNPKERDYRPHVHNIWGDATTLFFVRNYEHRNFCVPEPPAGTGTNRYTCDGRNRPLFLPALSTGGQSLLVPPGTATIRVQVSWDGAPGNDPKFVLRVTDNCNVGRAYYPKASGTSTYHQVPWGCTDSGHATRTTFGIAVEAWDTVYRTDAHAGPQDWKFKITIELSRGALPTEPAHVDFWDSKDFLRFKSPVVCYAPCKAANISVDHTRLEVMEGNTRKAFLIPPGTAWLEAKVTKSGEQKFPFQFSRLQYRSANIPGGNPEFCPPQMSASRCWQEAPTPSIAGDQFTFRITLKAGEADEEYAKRTGWRFWVITPDQENHERFVALKDVADKGSASVSNTVLGPWPTLAFEITAHRTPPP